MALTLNIAMLIPMLLRAAQPDAVDDRRMVQFVGEDGVVGGQHRLENARIGVEARRIQDGVLATMECGNLVLKFLYIYISI